MSFDTRKLVELLPAIYRLRDAELGRPLEALLSVIAGQIAVLEEDLQQLYDDQFIETCAAWAVPYLGDLIGYRQLHGVAPKVVSERAEVAHTIGFRRRKGTAAMLEQLARDVTGWNARVVESFQLLATTQSMNHLRPSHGYAPDLRQWEPLQRLNSAFETTAHTVDVRSIAGGDGKYNIPNIGVFLWRLGAYCADGNSGREAERRSIPTAATCSARWATTRRCSPARRPRRRSRIWPSRSTFRSQSAAACWTRIRRTTTGGKRVFRSSTAARKCRWIKIVVCNLSDIAGGGWAHPPPEDDPVTHTGAKLAVDPVLGRIAFPESIEPAEPHVTFHYGFSADMGGGEYQREDSFDRELQKNGRIVRVPGDQPTIAAALLALGSDSGVVEITDSGRYQVAVPINAAAQQRLELRAANQRRPLLVLSGELAIAGGGDSEVLLNGLLIAGHGLSVPAAGNRLSRLRLSHCTLVPGWGLTLTGEPQQPGAASLRVELAGVKMELDHCIVGGLRVAPAAGVTIHDSIVDATAETELAFADDQGTQPGSPLEVVDSTIIGRVHTVALELASNTIFLAQEMTGPPLAEPVFSERKQAGCVRFSFLPAGSRVPRRFRCQPDLAIERAIADARRTNPNLGVPQRKLIATEVRARLKPSFTDRRYGTPGYAQLRTSAPVEIRTGADDESEMGAFHQLHQPQRESNLRVRLDEYLRVGLEAGVFYAT